ncbi:MAG: hypothetical protein AB7N24_18515 [Dehalococcoidia bacterium]
MTQQPSRVIYLPPGVVPPPQVQQAPAIVPSGIPFDRAFFEQVIPSAVAGFCSQVGCTIPVLELMTVDGVTHYVNGISGVSDQWVALQTSLPDHPHPVQTFVPYQTIFRVEIHPEGDERRAHLGFVTENVRQEPEVLPPKPVPARAPAARTRRASTPKKS